MLQQCDSTWQLTDLHVAAGSTTRRGTLMSAWAAPGRNGDPATDRTSGESVVGCHDRGMKVEIRVDGVPPAQNEAKSMAAAVHSQSIRVRALLEAARASTHGLDLPAFPDGQLALDVTVMCPVQPSGDATNYLGGVGDVLQVKGRHGPVDHLRDLAEVAIYTMTVSSRRSTING
jgi:hypothetical protein